MELFRINKDIPFMRYAWVFNVISLITFVAAVAFLGLRGLNFSIEFTGGTQVEVGYTESARVDAIRAALVQAGVTEPAVQNFGSSRDVVIRLGARDLGLDSIATDHKLDTEKLLRGVLLQGGAKPQIKRTEFVGPQIGKELALNGLTALLVVCVGIIAYLAVRFEWRFAVATIIANLHDVVIILGFFAFFNWEFSLPVLAAVLAVLGYSVNESVVVFDRVRETFRKKRNLTTSEVIDHAITRTISRTVITHGATQMMVTAMLVFGGAALHNFALALTIGICFGIYSSVLVASPLVMWLGVSREQFVLPAVKGKQPHQGAVV